jgi:hypothetical protein
MFHTISVEGFMNFSTQSTPTLFTSTWVGLSAGAPISELVSGVPPTETSTEHPSTVTAAEAGGGVVMRGSTVVRRLPVRTPVSVAARIRRTSPPQHIKNTQGWGGVFQGRNCGTPSGWGWP